MATPSCPPATGFAIVGVGTPSRSPAMGFAIVGVGMLVLTFDTLLVRLASVNVTGGWAVTMYRYGFYSCSTCAYVAFGTFRAGRKRLLPTFAVIGPVGWLASVSFGVSNVCFVSSLLYTDVANTLVIVASSPVWTALISRVVLKEPLPWWTALTICGAVGAVLIVFLPEILAAGAGAVTAAAAAAAAAANVSVFSNASSQQLLSSPMVTPTSTPPSTTGTLRPPNATSEGGATHGDRPKLHSLGMLLALVTALSMAAYICCLRYAALRYPRRDMIPTTAIAGFLASLVGGIGAAASGKTVLLPASSMGWLALQGFVVLPIAFICMALGPRYISGTETQLLLLVETVFGPVWVQIAGFEAMSALGGVGMAVIVVCLLFNGVFSIRAANREKRSIEQSITGTTGNTDSTGTAGIDGAKSIVAVAGVVGV